MTLDHRGCGRGGAKGTVHHQLTIHQLFSRTPSEVLVVLHLGYSAALLALAGPILKIHAGLISRNELANEWRRNDFYIVVREQGEQVVDRNASGGLSWLSQMGS